MYHFVLYYQNNNAQLKANLFYWNITWRYLWRFWIQIFGFQLSAVTPDSMNYSITSGWTIFILLIFSMTAWCFTVGQSVSVNVFREVTKITADFDQLVNQWLLTVHSFTSFRLWLSLLSTICSSMCLCHNIPFRSNRLTADKHCFQRLRNRVESKAKFIEQQQLRIELVRVREWENI